MSKLNENRFWLARTKHGDQSTDTVSKKTGITNSLIQDIEGKNPDRNVSYKRIKKLAEYYGVTMDYLSGLTDCPSPDTSIRAICDGTGLSEEAVNYIISYKEREDENAAKPDMGGLVFTDKRPVRPESYLSQILHNEIFKDIVLALEEYEAISSLVASDISDILACESKSDPTEIDVTFFYDSIREMKDCFPQLRMMEYELSELWSDLLESIIPTKRLISEGKAIVRKYSDLMK